MRRSKKLLVILFLLVFLVSLGVLSYLFYASNLAPEQSDAGRIKPGDLLPQTVTKTTSVHSYAKDFPVANPQAGLVQYQCSKANKNEEWSIVQWHNENNLCNSSGAPVGNFENFGCNPGSTDARETSSSLYCYNRTTKTFTLGLDSSKMVNKGCTPSQSPLAVPNWPGGYSIYANYDNRDPFRNTLNYNRLGSLNELFVDLRFQNLHSAGTQCDAGLGEPADGKPLGFSYVSVIVSKVNPETYAEEDAMFYQLALYDSRPEIMEMETPYLNCNFNGPILATESVKKVFNKPVANPGDPMRRYNVDILPRLIKQIKACRGESSDTSDWRVKSMYIGSEMSNTMKMVARISNPKLVYKYNNDYARESVSKKSLHRYWCPSRETHAYAITAQEQEGLRKLGCNYEKNEGALYNARIEDTIPVYRLYDRAGTRFFMTSSTSERNYAMQNLGYSDAGTVGFMSRTASSQTSPIFRLYCQNINSHLYTTSSEERSSVINSGCIDEGTLGNVFSL